MRDGVVCTHSRIAIGREWSLLATLRNRTEVERHVVLERELFHVIRESCSGLRASEALLSIVVKHVKDWCDEYLPPSLQSQRRLAFSAAT